MGQKRVASLLFVLGGFVATSMAAAPFGMTWSTKSFGPDGPWQAVQVTVGSPEQTVALYPGGTFRSHLLTSAICSNSTISPGVCFASAGGIYTPDSSITSLEGIIQFPAATDFSHGGLEVQGSNGIGSLDQINIGSTIEGRRSIRVPNVTIALHDDVAAVYPGGLSPALEIGTLALGYLGTENQTFETGIGPAVNGSLIPGYLQAQGITPSNSFGLHIGSVRPKIPGSLYFGGYDQGRIVGDISTQQGPIAGIEGDNSGSVGFIDLLDIKLNVVDGSSPWNSTSIGNLLAAGNSSIGSALPVIMLPEAPYLNLPQSTCDAIAAWLPVSYRSEFGLYTWNTNDPNYNKIVSSPSVLSFVFRKNQLNTANITINVPFMLLNLTLEAPLTSVPTPYFPCNAQSHGRYTLGRAFLQAAFLGANWNANENQGVWWLAQAPGPNIGSQGNVQNIQDEDTSISASANNWLMSWKDSWTPLAKSSTTIPANNSSTSDSSSSAPTNSAGTSKNAEKQSGLSTGAKIGIGITAGVLVLAITVGVLVFLRRRRRRTSDGVAGPEVRERAIGAGDVRSNDYISTNYATSDYNTSAVNESMNSTPDSYYSGKYRPFRPAELNGQRPVHEMMAHKPVYEMGPSH